MNPALETLWLIPVLPLVAAAVTVFATPRQRMLAAGVAIAAMAGAFVLSVRALLPFLDHRQTAVYHNFPWLEFGTTTLQLGWILDPLTALMLVMVTFVGLLIFIYSVGYLAHDARFPRFFCFLSLFAAAMLGLIIANNLLLLFMCWELVGLASYLLIGFWYHKPAAAAAARKAFITTRIGDIGLFLGLLWLYRESGTLLCYDFGRGCLEEAALAGLAGQVTFGGMTVATAVALLLFCGAVGKSGQLPLHVWLPDAMEGPTPVSALIHAATMVAAGVFLMARVYPLLAVDAAAAGGATTALTVITWVGALTAVFAAAVAVAQTDIKRILAYSTVSQLGYMFVGLGVGGVAVGMFHLITHAFFKALLFLGAGSVIHGCHEEQDIRRMGGLRQAMPVTFATYTIGMLALAGIPPLAGFWSKDEILHRAHGWLGSSIPYYLLLAGGFLTAFYMTRQMALVFFGEPADKRAVTPPHESPAIMTLPLILLAVCALWVGLLGTPMWPWFDAFVNGRERAAVPGALGAALPTMLISSLVAGLGIALGWWWYGRGRRESGATDAPLARLFPELYPALVRRLGVDELYAATVIRWFQQSAIYVDWLERRVWQGAMLVVAGLSIALGWLSRLTDEYLINLGFRAGCDQLKAGGRQVEGWHRMSVQQALRTLGIALTILVLLLSWGWKR